ncbi:hypothetical protein CN176_03435 [Sinorhizobium medicae]|uniref:hypothetical protein n=1 Tax=Sinorhizobium medicae TaxID=110321 RepID=UPI000FD88962|nr:hypothetical protein [Sinorhizobium medicae]RVJ45851.1 hypothetical protein CN176_03435 [Sinorhizobium medicae]
MKKNAKGKTSSVEGAAKAVQASVQPVAKIVRRIETEPSANLNIRPPITTYNRFVSYAIRERLSYPAALKALLDNAGE